MNSPKIRGWYLSSCYTLYISQHTLETIIIKYKCATSTLFSGENRMKIVAMMMIMTYVMINFHRGGAEGLEGRVPAPPGQSGRVLCIGAGGSQEAPRWSKWVFCALCLCQCCSLSPLIIYSVVLSVWWEIFRPISAQVIWLAFGWFYLPTEENKYY